MPRKRKRNFIECRNCGKRFRIFPGEIRPYCDDCLYKDLMEKIGIIRITKKED